MYEFGEDVDQAATIAGLVAGAIPAGDVPEAWVRSVAARIRHVAFYEWTWRKLGWTLLGSAIGYRWSNFKKESDVTTQVGCTTAFYNTGGVVPPCGSSGKPAGCPSDGATSKGTGPPGFK